MAKMLNLLFNYIIYKISSTNRKKLLDLTKAFPLHLEIIHRKMFDLTKRLNFKAVNN